MGESHTESGNNFYTKTTSGSLRIDISGLYFDFVAFFASSRYFYICPAFTFENFNSTTFFLFNQDV